MANSEYNLSVVNGTALTISLSGPAGPAGATPAGGAGSVQFSNGTALAADSGLVYTGTGNTGVLKIGGGSVIMSDLVTVENLVIGNGNPTLPLAARTTGTSNTVIGSKSMIALTEGSGNFAIGSRSLAKLTTGNRNIAIGTATLPELTTGTSNIGIGENALLGVTTAFGNIAIGSGAGGNIVTGWNNISIAGSPPLANSENSICIGTNGDGSNTTVIGKSVTTQTRLIGNTLILGRQDLTTGTDKRTSIVQTAQTDNKTITLPNATGTVPVYTDTPAIGQVLTATDASGAATWETPTAGTAVTGTAPIDVTSGVISLLTTLPSAYAFTNATRPTSAATTGTLAAASASSIITKGDADSRYGSAIGARVYKNNVDQIIVSGAANFQLVTYGSEIYDYGSCWDTATSKYTATVAGIYMVTGLFDLRGGSWNGGYVHVFKNGTRAHDIVSNVSTNAAHNTSTALYLAVGDYIEIKCSHATGADRTISGYINGINGNAMLTISLVSPNL